MMSPTTTTDQLGKADTPRIASVGGLIVVITAQFLAFDSGNTSQEAAVLLLDDTGNCQIPPDITRRPLYVRCFVPAKSDPVAPDAPVAFKGTQGVPGDIICVPRPVFIHSGADAELGKTRAGPALTARAVVHHSAHHRCSYEPLSVVEQLQDSAICS